MQLTHITSSTDPLLAHVPHLYETAFPEDERTNTARLIEMVEACPEMTFNAIMDDGTFCGMAVIWELGICRYLLYLATLEERRNEGLGSQTLELLKAESPLPIIGEVERPTDPIKARRIKFYERNGFPIESTDPTILNEAHTHSTCVLQLISTHKLDNLEACLHKVVDIVYAGLHPKEDIHQ